MSERFKKRKPEEEEPSTKKMTRRGFIKGIGAMTVGAIVGGSSEQVAQEYKNHKLESVTILLQKKRSFFESDAIYLENAKQLVKIDDASTENLPTFIYNRFKDGIIPKHQYMPDNIRGLLAEIIPGIPAQESRYDKKAKSPKGALGWAQLKPKTILGTLHFTSLPKETTKETVLGDEYNTTEVMFAHFDRFIYQVFVNHGVPEQLKRAFSLTNTERDELLVLFMINAYNAGAKTIENTIDWLEVDIPKTEIMRHRTTILELFHFLSIHALETIPKNKPEIKYRLEAQGYVLNVLAGAEVSNELFIRDTVSQTDKTESNTTAFIGGTLAGTAGDALLHEQTTVHPKVRDVVINAGIRIPSSALGGGIGATAVNTTTAPTYRYWWR